MSQSILQVKGIDTKVETFVPSRANPVARRAVRRYLAQQPVEGTSKFSNLSFQVEQTSENMVINELRMVFPLRLNAIGLDENNDEVPLEMHTNSWKAGSNIAIAQNAPFSAFQNLEIAINGKVYTEQFQQYGKMLGQCHQTYGELQFQNDESLKPIANSLVGSYNPDYTIRSDQGDTITIDRFDPEPSTFSLLENNSGFIARRRAFEDGLTGDGLTWEGEISSLVNSSLFNSEARSQGNSQIPYVRNLYVNCVFAQNQNRLDEAYALVHPDQERYTRVIPQRLFEFLTPFTAAFPGTHHKTPRNHFAYGYKLVWTAQPRLEIEWIKYQKPLLSDVYRLRGFQYQLEQTMPFKIPFNTAGDDRIEAWPEQRDWVPVRMNRQLLSVPNLIYLWVEATEASARNCFAWGGMFRTCDIRSVKIRVNGATEIISNPSMQTLYKWYKRNTNNVHEFPTYLKNKIIVISPSEIGLQEFLAQDAKISTFNISLETSQSRLMLPEFAKFHEPSARAQSGYRTPHLEYIEFPEAFNTNGAELHANDVELDRLSFTSDYSGNPYIRTNQHRLYLRVEDRFLNTQSSHARPALPVREAIIQEALGDRAWRVKDESEKFSITRVDDSYFAWEDGFSYWVKVNITGGGVQGDANGKLLVWVSIDSNTFQMATKHYNKPELLSWQFFDDAPEHSDNDGSIDATAFHDPSWLQTDDGENWVDRITTCAGSLVSDVFYKDHEADMRTNVRTETSPFNLLTDNELNVYNRGAMNKERVVPAKVMMPLVYRYQGASAWTFEDDAGESERDGQAGGQEAYLDEDMMKNGWRWVRMTNPSSAALSNAVSVGNSFQGKKSSGDDMSDYKHPRLAVLASVRVERGIEDTRPVKYEYEGSNLGLESHIADHARPLGIESVEYSLNCLFEYNNQTVLMDSSRGKPLHFSNNVRAYDPNTAV